VYVKDNGTGCTSILPFSVLSNTQVPQVSVNTANPMLTCKDPSVVLQGQSNTPNVSFAWTFPGTPGVSPGPTLTVGSNTSAPSLTLVANYTFVVTDNSSTCKSTTIFPVYQNIFPPKAKISSASTFITCSTQTIMLSNQSTSAIPPVFNPTQPVISSLWEGPMPQNPLQNSSVYTASVPGTYTMTALDLNNGCISFTTFVLSDYRNYPVVNNPVQPGPFNLCGQASVKLTPVISSPTTNLTYSWSAPVNATVTGVSLMQLTTNAPGTYTIAVRDNVSGCVTTATMEVIECVGLGTEFESNGFDIFPNPGTGLFMLRSNKPGPLDVEIFDISGNLIRTLKVLTSETLIDLTSESRGIYFLQLRNKNEFLQSRKILVE
jgi:hypothetical protein